MNSKVIEVIALRKYFRKKGVPFSKRKECVKAVDGISFAVEKGKTFGLVGESGCGKSTVAKLLVGILQPDSGRISIQGDRDLVFQDPYSSLNPRMTVRDIVGESLYVRGLGKKEIERKVRETLSLVRLGDPGCPARYPHQFSGGERQRIAIARALIRRPEILVLDEPVSSLDVSIQAGILNLFKDLQEELGLTYLFISHDLRVVEFMSDTVGVMKEGTLVEIASKEEIYSSPGNEYTRRLLESIPKMISLKND
ncbi:MAG: ATP-binding cassette domain-containing protein [Candidatus Omnitrophota bacterium]|nr:ATP-binding cassette domain-containing protein [Candidatus Omnitrophota bacterium]